MGNGYVLKFSDRTFSEFFSGELNIDIDNPIYEREGTSKGKRLRYFLRTVDNATAARTLQALWEYREAEREESGEPEDINNAQGRLLAIINKLSGQAQTAPSGSSPIPASNSPQFFELKDELLKITSLEPQARGYAFEKFLTKLFNLHGLSPREPFRNRGEQIDGSFQLSHETYLVEAKYTGNATSAAELHVFQSKIDQKATWSRGLFVSISGFTQEGLDAFGRRKSVICMDGLDLFEMLEREIPLNSLLEQKIRKAAETGLPYVGIRDLFP